MKNYQQRQQNWLLWELSQQIMLKKYIISIEEQECYPFDGPKPAQMVVVRVTHTVPSDSLFPALLRKLARVVAIRSHSLLPVLRVRQTRGRSLEIDYEYIPEALSRYYKVSEAGFLGNVREKLMETGAALAEAGIRAQLRAENLGVREDGELRIFIGLNFSIVEQFERAALTAEYAGAVDRLLQVFGFPRFLRAKSETQQSQHSQRVDKKLSEMQGKLNKLKLRSRHSSHSNSLDSSSNSRSKNIVLQSVCRQSSNSSFSAETSHSAITDTRPKVHKSSFGDYSTSSCRLEESLREENLGKRISHALEKTQEAFKTYQKYSRRKRRI